MMVKTGTDILNKTRFLESAKNGKSTFLEKIFTPYEIQNNSPEQLAGIFCLKEAIVKALELPSSSWLTINTTRQKNGKLVVSFTNTKFTKHISSLDTSISHEGDMIIAICVALLEN